MKDFNLRCDHCAMMWRDPDARLVPACCEPQGCEIEELAVDQSLVDDCISYMTAKKLYQITQDPKVQETVFKELGLYDDPASLLDMEEAWAAWVKEQRATVK